jgi:hypothetical protein
MTILGLIPIVAAFASFALASDRHRGRWSRSRPVATDRRLRLVAWSLLPASFAIVVAGRGWAFGPVAWLGLVMAGAGIVLVTMNLLLPARR